MTFQIDGKEAVGTIRVARTELKALRDEQRDNARATDDGRKAAEAYVGSIKKKFETLGLTRAEMVRYEAAQNKLTEAETRAVESMDRQIERYEQVGSAAEKFGRALGGLAATAGAAAAATAGMIKKEAIEAAIQAAEANIRLESVLKATGYAAGLTKKQLDDLADSMAQSTRFDDESIRNGIAAVLKFKDVQGDTFETVIRLAADYAEAMNTDFKSAAELFGRSFQDIDHAQRLTIATGGRFSDTLRDNIKAMMENGQVAEAHAILLDRLKGSVGGTAEAMNTGLLKASADMKKGWGELMEAIGQTDRVGGRAEVTMSTLAQVMGDMKGQINGTSNAFRDFFLQLRTGVTAVDYVLLAIELGVKATDKKPSFIASRGREFNQSGDDQAAAGRAAQDAARAADLAAAATKRQNEENEKAALAYAKVTGAADEYLKSLEIQRDSVGATTEQKILLQAATRSMTLATERERMAFLAKAVAIASDTQKAEENLKAKNDAIEAAKRAEEAAKREIDAIQQQIEKQKEHNYELVNGKGSWDAYQASLIETEIAMRRMTGASEQDLDTLRKKSAALKELASLQSTGEAIADSQKAAKKFYDDLERNAEHFGQTLEEAVTNALFEGGKSGTEIVKGLFRSLVLQPQISMGFQDIARSLYGLPAAGGAGGGGGLGGLLNAGSSLFSGGAATTGMAGGLAGMLANGAFGLGNLANSAGFTGIGSGLINFGAAAGGGAGSGIMGALGSGAGALASAAPYIAAAMALYQVLQSRRGGPKEEGGYLADYTPGGATARVVGNTYHTNNTLGAQFEDINKGVASSYFAALRELGGSAGVGASFGIGGDMDPRGSANSRLSSQVWVNGQERRYSLNRDAGRGAEEFQTQINTETSRMLLVALQSSNLPTYLANVLNEVSAETGTREEIDKVIQRAREMKQAFGGLEEAGRSVRDIIDSIAGDSLGMLARQIELLNQSVEDAQASFDTAATGSDPAALLQAEQALQAAILNHYNTISQALAQATSAIGQIQENRYGFNDRIGRMLIEAGGTGEQVFGEGGMGKRGRVVGVADRSDARASSIRSAFSADATPEARLQSIDRYLTAIGNAYDVRRAAIEAQDRADRDAFTRQVQATQRLNQAQLDTVNQQLEVANLWVNVLAQAKQQIDQIRFSAANPLSASARLDIAQRETGGLFDRFNAATGKDKANLAERLLPMLQTQIGLLGDSSQRPSAEYAQVYNQIMAMYGAVQEFAQTETDRAQDLSATQVALQEAIAADSERISQYTSDAAARLEQLNDQYREQLLWAQNQGDIAYADDERRHQDIITTITGGVDQTQFLVDLNRESSERLTSIDEQITAFLARVTAGSEPTVTVPVTVVIQSSGGTGNGGSNGLGGSTTLSNDTVQQLTAQLQPVFQNLVRQNRTFLNNQLDVA